MWNILEGSYVSSLWESIFSHSEQTDEALAAQAERMGTASSLRSRLANLMKTRRTFEAEKLKGYLLDADNAEVVRKFLRYPRWDLRLNESLQ